MVSKKIVDFRQKNLNELVSIIVPNYNHFLFLEKRLDSIFNQTYQNFEVILLDDASSDNSLDILERYRNHPKVPHFIVNEKNSGSPFKQWQKGLELAQGKFIWIAESDDTCDLNFLESQVNCVDNADVAVAKTLAFNEGSIENEVMHPVFKFSNKEDALLRCPILNVSTVLFKAKLIHNFKDQEYTNFKVIGDRVFYFEYFRHANIVFNTATLSYFRQSDMNISKLKNRNLTYYKHYFKEHCRFIFYAKQIDPTIERDVVNAYLHRFYSRVRDRLTVDQKRSMTFLFLYFFYKIKVLSNKTKL